MRAKSTCLVPKCGQVTRYRQKSSIIFTFVNILLHFWEPLKVCMWLISGSNFDETIINSGFTLGSPSEKKFKKDKQTKKTKRQNKTKKTQQSCHFTNEIESLSNVKSALLLFWCINLVPLNKTFLCKERSTISDNMGAICHHNTSYICSILLSLNTCPDKSTSY